MPKFINSDTKKIVKIVVVNIIVPVVVSAAVVTVLNKK